MSDEREDFDLDDKKVLLRMVRSAIHSAPMIQECPHLEEPGPFAGPNWHKVSVLFSCGSTHAIVLCRHFGIDPHAEMKGDQNE